MAELPGPGDPNPLAEACRRCPDLLEDRECIAWGNGSTSAAVVIVGESPGAGDPAAPRWKGGNWTGLAYTSRASGRKIRRLFADIGYDPEELYFTNAVKCFPSDGEGGNREPTDRELASCRPYLRQEIEQIEPACVVATGKHATRSLLAAEGRDLEGFLEGFLEVVLEPVACDRLGVPVLPVLHPSYQEVWISRLGYTRESYIEAVAEGIRESRNLTV